MNKSNKHKHKIAMGCPYNEHNKTKVERDLPELIFN